MTAKIYNLADERLKRAFARGDRTEVSEFCDTWMEKFDAAHGSMERLEDKPLTELQYRNHKNLLAWRIRYERYQRGKNYE